MVEAVAVETGYCEPAATPSTGSFQASEDSF